jgi:hypothetical protein
MACLVPFAVLFMTALLLGRTHGAPIAGVRTGGRPGTLLVDGDGLRVSIGARTWRFAHAELASGWTERFLWVADDVVLQTRGGEIVRARAASREEARAILEAARIAPEQRAVTLRLGVAEPTAGRVLAIFLALFVGLSALGTVLGFVGLALRGSFHDQPSQVALLLGLPLILMIVGWSILLRPLLTTTVRIGSDGIAIERLFKRRFIPRAAFLHAQATGNELEIRSRTRMEHLYVSTAAEATAVAERIHEAMAEQRAAAVEAVQGRLDRHGRAIGSWILELRGRASGASDYRNASLHPDDLAAVLEDGAASAERRIAAAAALARDDAGRRRVRVAAEACADDRLRVAILEAAEDEVDERRIALALS